MSSIPGSVALGGFIAPTDDTDVYPVTDPKWGLGGLRTVVDVTARNAVATSRREEGMLVFVVDEGKTYQLKGGITNGDWEEFASGGGDTYWSRTGSYVSPLNLGDDIFLKLTAERGLTIRPEGYIYGNNAGDDYAGTSLYLRSGSGFVDDDLGIYYNGRDVYINAGEAGWDENNDTASAGGRVLITGGNQADGMGDGAGGVWIIGGESVDSSDNGVYIQGGYCPGGEGGSVTIETGSYEDNDPGSFYLRSADMDFAGKSATFTLDEDFSAQASDITLRSDGDLYFTSNGISTQTISIDQTGGGELAISNWKHSSTMDLHLLPGTGKVAIGSSYTAPTADYHSTPKKYVDDINTVLTNAISLKADTTYVDTQDGLLNTAIGLKADTTYVDTQDGTLATAISLKADTTYVDTQDGTLNTAIGLRALKSNVLELDNTDTYTPTEDYHPATKAYADSIGGSLWEYDGDSGSVKLSIVRPLDLQNSQINNIMQLNCIRASSSQSGGPSMFYRRSRGTEAVPTAITNSDAIGYTFFYGHDGSAFAQGGYIGLRATEDWSGTNRGTGMFFGTVKNGESSANNRLFLHHNGNVGINYNNPDASLDIRAEDDNNLIRLRGLDGGSAETGAKIQFGISNSNWIGEDTADVFDINFVDGMRVNNSTIITEILDEDTFTSDSDEGLATQQSIKAFTESGRVQNIVSKIADYTVTNTDYTVLADGTSDTVVISLPSTPLQGQIFNVSCINITNACSIGRNGKNIDGGTSDISLALDQNVQLQYDTTYGWKTLTS